MFSMVNSTNGYACNRELLPPIMTDIVNLDVTNTLVGDQNVLAHPGDLCGY